jgi:hypothetical protein
MPLTYVTAFIDIYGKNSLNKPNSMRYENFKKVAETGIPVIAFVDPQSFEVVKSFSLPNIVLVSISLEELETYQMIQNIPFTLPEHRCPKKDTVEFMTIMHSKAEFLHRASQINSSCKHFAWMDFSLSYIFKEMDKSLEHLVFLSKQNYKEKLFVIPGCWSKGEHLENIWNKIYWRFCGGFFIADQQSIKEFYTLYKDTLFNILSDKKRMIWETNIWALFEIHYNWNPTWYLADHNDSIHKVPSSSFL